MKKWVKREIDRQLKNIDVEVIGCGCNIIQTREDMRKSADTGWLHRSSGDYFYMLITGKFKPEEK